MDLSETVTVEVFKNLSSVFWTYYSENGLLLSNKTLTEEVLSIFKLFNITYSKSYEALIFKYKGFTFYKKFSDISSSDSVGRVTPIKLSYLDIEDIEKVLNKKKYEDFSHYLSPIFDSIGYILINTGSSFHIEFFGSALYDAWKEFYALEDSENNLNGKWKEGLTTDMSKPMNWLSLKDIS